MAGAWATGAWAAGAWAGTAWATDTEDVAPTITTASLPNGTEGVAYSQQLAATGSGPITWSLESPVPIGWSINASTGVVSRASPSAGTVILIVKAENGAGSDVNTFAFQIAAADEFEDAAPVSRQWRVTTSRIGRSIPGIRRRLDGLAWVEKAPGDELDYGFEYADELEGGETIDSSTWEASPTGIDLGAEGVEGSVATQWVSGGTAGTDYTLANTITTSGGRTFVRTLKVRVLASVS